MDEQACKCISNLLWCSNITTTTKYCTQTKGTSGCKSMQYKYMTSFTLGHYLYVETSSPARTGDKARLVSTEMAASEKTCMSFWYHMWGSYMGSLKVFKVENGKTSLLWEKSSDQGNQWHEGKVNITSKTKFKVISFT